MMELITKKIKEPIIEPNKVITEHKYTNNYYKIFLDYLNETQDIPKVIITL
jgi:hypothetical protein